MKGNKMRIFSKIKEVISSFANKGKISIIEGTDEKYTNIVKQMEKFESNVMLNRFLSMEKRIAELTGHIVALREQIKVLNELGTYNATTTDELLNAISSFEETDVHVIDDDEDGLLVSPKDKKLSIN
jgi:hypothetical protein